jgi:hypothetical protein
MKKIIHRQLEKWIKVLDQHDVGTPTWEEATEAAERLSKILMHLEVAAAASSCTKIGGAFGPR